MTLQMYLLEHEMEAEERGLAQGIERGRNEERETLSKCYAKANPLTKFTNLPTCLLNALNNSPTIILLLERKENITDI